MNQLNKIVSNDVKDFLSKVDVGKVSLDKLRKPTPLQLTLGISLVAAIGAIAVGSAVAVALTSDDHQEKKAIRKLSVEDAMKLQMKHIAHSLTAFLKDARYEHMNVPIFSLNASGSTLNGESFLGKILLNDYLGKLWENTPNNKKTVINVMSPEGNRDFLILAHNPERVNSEGKKGVVLAYSSTSRSFYDLETKPQAGADTQE